MLTTTAAPFADERSAEFGLAPRHDPRPCCLLRPRDVADRAALSLSHVYRLIGDGRFPPFDVVAHRASGLPEHVLDVFFAERMAARKRLPALGYRSPLPVWRFDRARVPAWRAVRLLRRRDVLARVALSKSTLHRLVAEGRFPAPVSLGVRATRWVEHEVDDWVHSAAAPDPGVSAPSEAVPDRRISA